MIATATPVQVWKNGRQIDTVRMKHVPAVGTYLICGIDQKSRYVSEIVHQPATSLHEEYVICKVVN